MPLPLLALAGGAMLGQGISSYLGAQAQRDAARESSKALTDALNKQLGFQEQTYQDVTGMYQPYMQAGQQAFEQYQQFDPTVQMGDFSYGKTAQDFLDPSMQYQQTQARRALEANAAATGALGSGAYAQELQQQAMNIAQQDYANAYNRMQNDKQFQYQDYLNRFNNARTNNQARMQQIQNIANVGQTALGNVASTRNAWGQQQSAGAATQGNINAQMANVNAMTSPTAIAGNVIGSMTNPNTLMQFGKLAGMGGV